MLAITANIDKKIEKGKYKIILISKKNLKNALEKNTLPWLPMLKEAKPVINKELIEKYAQTPLTKKNLEPHIELTKSALALNKAHLDLDEAQGNITSDAVAYSLVLRTRGIYIVNCLRQEKIATTAGLKSIIQKKAGSLRAYEGYSRTKEDKKSKKELPIREARALLLYAKNEIKEQEQWIKERK